MLQGKFSTSQKADRLAEDLGGEYYKDLDYKEYKGLVEKKHSMMRQQNQALLGKVISNLHK